MATRDRDTLVARGAGTLAARCVLLRPPGGNRIDTMQRALPLMPLAGGLALCAAIAAGAGAAETEAPLPPVAAWSGASEQLATAPGDAWATPAEVSGLRRTASYEQTSAFLRRLAAASPDLELTTLGKSPEGRELWLLVAARGAAKTPAALRASGKPIVFAQAGIHSGEIDGNDAGLMLLRDVVEGRHGAGALLDAAHLLFLPIFNVDGHERASRYARMNQRGPEQQGWRTTARNLNLNRDYAKADAVEMRHLLQALAAWQPDLYLDLHVTDGADYQYDLTYGWNGPHAWSPTIATWLDWVLRPAVDAALQAAGHVPGPLVQTIDALDPAKGMYEWTAAPRFSTGYGDARQLPTVLLENHSLKPFRRRVLGTRVFLEAVLRQVGREAAGLREAISKDRARRPKSIVLDWKRHAGQPPLRPFLGIGWKTERSAVSGGERLVYTGEPVTFQMPIVEITEPAATVARPAAWWVPAAWSDVIERLARHGIRMERLGAPREVELDVYRIRDPKLEDTAFEGHVRVAGLAVPERRRERLAAGSVRVPGDQPLGTLAALLLEPASPDSFFQWGFFDEVLQRTEYYEDYVMEPLGAAMLAADGRLRAEFEKRLAEDAAFAASPQARLDWLYARSPYYDERFRLYPVGREP